VNAEQLVPLRRSMGMMEIGLLTHTEGEPVEVSYGGYLRRRVERSRKVWQVKKTGVMVNKTPIDLPTCHGGYCTVTHLGLYLDGRVIYTFPLSYPICISSGITPSFAKRQLQVRLP
jgi:hypothetical protein